MQEVTNKLRSGQRIYVAGSSNEPTGLLRDLAASELPENLEFIQFPLPGLNQTDFTQFNDTASVTTFFMSSALAKGEAARVNYLPMQMRATYDYLATNVDVYLLQVAHDQEGRLRVGPNVDFHESVLAQNPTVIAQLNPSMVAPAGSPLMNPALIDVLIANDVSAPALAPANIDDAAQEIGRLVAGLIRDGDCLQTGIGAIPAAILNQLTDKNDLGMHGGLIDDGGMRLIQQGNLTGAQKTIDTGKHITGMALGSDELMQWLATERNVVFRGANHTHEVSAIRQLDGFVSVNSAVEVDLFGQVNAEMAGGRQISGTGGSVDFMRAAKASKGGRSIVAMNATARGGSVSRIVPKVEMVTALRTDVDTVVTEHGVAQIKDLPNRARAEALIQIAAPQFRDKLRDAL
ncbi:MAG: acetyl-CoA hydrolase [Gammaproteobacteria bacterium]|jgi:4-hydroxybutyrate CoA-transferase|nr:acetyl-CoA hydrolase [Gammaproteobacteria bacterium]